MAQSFTNLLYHVVFATKGREALLTAEVRGQIYPYMSGVVAEHGGTCLAINIDPQDEWNELPRRNGLFERRPAVV